MTLIRILVVALALGLAALGIWLSFVIGSVDPRASLPSGNAHPVQITDSVGTYSASIVGDAGGSGLNGLVFVQ
jgi:hypothetical protein